MENLLSFTPAYISLAKPAVRVLIFVATTCVNGSVFPHLLPLKLEVQKLTGC